MSAPRRLLLICLPIILVVAVCVLVATRIESAGLAVILGLVLGAVGAEASFIIWCNTIDAR